MSQPPPPPNMPPPPPGYGYGAVPQQRLPSQVNVASILFFIGGGFAILSGLLLLVLGSIGAIFAVIGVVVLVIGGLEIWVGVALRQLKPWARTTAIVLAAVGGVLQLIGMFKGGYTGIVGLAFDIIIIYLLSQPDAKRAFETSGR